MPSELQPPAMPQAVFKALLDHSETAALLLDARGVVRYATPAVARCVGHAHGALVGQTLFHHLHGDDRRGADEAFYAVVHTPGESRSVLARVLGVEGEWRTLVITVTNPIADPDIQGVLVALRDTTDAVRLRDQRSETHRTEIVSRLSRDLTHEINNALTVIVSYAELLAAEAYPTRPRELAEIRDAATAATALTRQLAALVGSSGQRMQLTSVLDALERVRRVSGRAMPSGVRLRIVAEPRLPPLLIEPPRLDQILMDVVFNARDNLPAHGTIRLAARVLARETTAGHLAPFLELVITGQSDAEFPAPRPSRADALAVARGLVRGTGGEMVVGANGEASVTIWLPLATFETPAD